MTGLRGTIEVVARATKKHTNRSDELSEEYYAVQLTPDAKANARAEVQRKIDQARHDGVYERVLDLVGRVKWTATWEELRKEDDEA